MRRNIYCLLSLICVVFISCNKSDSLVNSSLDYCEQESGYEEILSAIDSLNYVYGVEPISLMETRGLGKAIGSHYADQFGAKLGANIGKRIGSSLGVVTANPVVGVVGYLGGRYIGGVAGSIAASWLAGALITGGIAALLEAPVQIDDNTTVGEVHNIILNKLHTNGEVYITSSGVVLFDKLYDDILEIESDLGLEDELSNDMAYRSEMKSFCLDVYQNTKNAIVNNENQSVYLDRLSNTLIRFDVPEEEVREFRELNERLVVASYQLDENQAISYEADFEKVVDSTTLPLVEKSEIKTVGSISIQSTQYWK